MKRTFILIGVVLVVAVSLIAGERREMVGERGELSQYLGLSTDQRAAWDAARQEFGTAAEPLERQHHAAMEQVEASLKSKSPDACAIGNSFIAAQSLRNQLRAAKEALTQKQLAVLTPEQRTKYEAFVAARGEGEMKLRRSE